MSSPFEVIPLGVGDTFSATHVTASLLLRCEGFTLAIDAPDRYRGVLARASTADDTLALSTIDDVLITHVHGDHVNGLEGIAFFKRFAQQRRVRLYTLPEVVGPLWDRRLFAPMSELWDGKKKQTMRFSDYFDMAEPPRRGVDRPEHGGVIDPNVPREIGPFTVRARRTIHHVPTSALLIEGGGVTLGYSADTAFDPDLIEWLSSADLIIHETNHGPAHTPYEKLEALPAELRQKMRLIHYPDGFDVDDSAIVALREGQRIRVGETP
ncbi:MAG: MBL fold metallo-hydrolase [Polyangiales bacterium]